MCVMESYEDVADDAGSELGEESPPPPDARTTRRGVYSAWLKKVKGDGAKTRWLYSTTTRYFTIDFDNQTFFYSHNKEQKKISRPITFKDILGAERLQPSTRAAKRGAKGSQSSGFLLKTAGRAFELHAHDGADAAQWVFALNAARDMAAAMGDVVPELLAAAADGAGRGQDADSPAPWSAIRPMHPVGEEPEAIKAGVRHGWVGAAALPEEASGESGAASPHTTGTARTEPSPGAASPSSGGAPAAALPPLQLPPLLAQAAAGPSPSSRASPADGAEEGAEENPAPAAAAPSAAAGSSPGSPAHGASPASASGAAPAPTSPGGAAAQGAAAASPAASAEELPSSGAPEALPLSAGPATPAASQTAPAAGAPPSAATGGDAAEDGASLGGAVADPAPAPTREADASPSTPSSSSSSPSSGGLADASPVSCGVADASPVGASSAAPVPPLSTEALAREDQAAPQPPAPEVQAAPMLAPKDGAAAPAAEAQAASPQPRGVVELRSTRSGVKRLPKLAGHLARSSPPQSEAGSGFGGLVPGGAAGSRPGSAGAASQDAERLAAALDDVEALTPGGAASAAGAPSAAAERGARASEEVAAADPERPLRAGDHDGAPATAAPLLLPPVAPEEEPEGAPDVAEMLLDLLPGDDDVEHRFVQDLRCAGCDHQVLQVDGHVWDGEVERSFLDTCYPEVAQLRSKLRAQSGANAFCCRCAFRAVRAGAPASEIAEGLRWREAPAPQPPAAP